MGEHYKGATKKREFKIIFKKSCWCLMTRFNFLKHMQHFDAHTSARKNEKEKKF